MHVCVEPVAGSVPVLVRCLSNLFSELAQLALLLPQLREALMKQSLRGSGGIAATVCWVMARRIGWGIKARGGNHSPPPKGTSQCEGQVPSAVRCILLKASVSREGGAGPSD
jgi:hypothetical protein